MLIYKMGSIKSMIFMIVHRSDNNYYTKNCINPFFL